MITEFSWHYHIITLKTYFQLLNFLFIELWLFCSHISNTWRINLRRFTTLSEVFLTGKWFFIPINQRAKSVLLQRQPLLTISKYQLALVATMRINKLREHAWVKKSYFWHIFHLRTKKVMGGVGLVDSVRTWLSLGLNNYLLILAISMLKH